MINDVTLAVPIAITVRVVRWSVIREQRVYERAMLLCKGGYGVFFSEWSEWHSTTTTIHSYSSGFLM